MKKLSLILLSALFAVVLHAEQQCDAIVTTDNFQIQCIVTNIGNNEIQYKDCQADNDEIKTILISSIRKLYLHDGTVTDYSNRVAPIPHEPENVSVPPVEDKPSAPAETTHPSNEAPDTIQIASTNVSMPARRTDIDIAHVEKSNGLFVFTDCSPIAEYEVIGEVSTNGTGNRDLQNSLGQYEAVRDELIKIARAANSQVEGVILTFVTGGYDKAHLIKFKDPSKDCSLARVKRYSGIYIFCDNTPLCEYEYLGNLKGKFTFIPQYVNLRDHFVQKCRRKYKNANGVILHLVTRGKDSAEAINLK